MTQAKGRYDPRVTIRGDLHSSGRVRISGAPRTLRVLIVEDDQDGMRSLMLLLRTEGYEVRGVGSATAMWGCAGEFVPDAILLDINLPDRSGYEVARDLRRVYPEGSVRPLLVAVTAWNKGSDKILAELAGFDHHIGKPYEPAALLTILRELDAGLGTRS
jgi:DNA-binding response OmpR family regulator